MHAAEDDGNPPWPEPRRELIRARRGAGDRADAHEIGVDAIGIDVVDALVDDPDCR